ncbi:hypothetical protein [Methanofollis fontis]|uniref:Uncharacterized protein n=1 Tax=Methanofollis fontis TaxID=2052832 RepID=A0A483CVA9_9EURY|nr:hypothetical protein [Methanofollis fontis]TAJ44907.1 hypothetical protein CUJ86_06395 [Methanofollis fontis]
MEDGAMLVALGEIGVVILALIGVGVAGCMLYLIRIREQLDAIRKEGQERQQAAQLRSMIGGPAQAPVDMFRLFKHIERTRQVELDKPPKKIELITGRSNILESMNALCEKYYLDAFTVATDDGLLVASSEEDATDDAARYSHVFASGNLPDDPQVMLFGIRHKGSDMVGIIRTKHNIPENWVQGMEDDVVSILKQWL